MDYLHITHTDKTVYPDIKELAIRWDPEYVIDSLPPWVYKNHAMPQTMNGCMAKISALQHTLTDMDLQIEVRKCEKRLAELNHDHFDEVAFYEKIRKIHKAKQSTLYVISALKYWQNLNRETYKLKEEFENFKKHKYGQLLTLLAEDPPDFSDKVLDLLD